MRGVDSRWIGGLLRQTRVKFGMDMALLLSLDSDTLRVEVASGATNSRSPRTGEQFLWSGSLCERVARDGFGSVDDIALSSLTFDLSSPRELGITAYVGTPIMNADGSRYGALCCISGSRPDVSLQESAEVMAQVAAAISHRLDGGVKARLHGHRIRLRVTVMRPPRRPGA